ncbi:hypothetical protein [Microvirga rosea]|uniref:hypothetical protein n=1 Tax=Microvirga rosea TaxID=2715425 RepID=UPI001D0B0713|nr:hypothetical protein [Microvirga rosea]MCB8819382.1 hypothetical protein [Microvirga rosea]
MRLLALPFIILSAFALHPAPAMAQAATAAGAGTGALAGAVVGGPIGAAVGGVIGGVVGASAERPRVRNTRAYRKVAVKRSSASRAVVHKRQVPVARKDSRSFRPLG